MDGGCRPTTNGARWRSTLVELGTIRLTRVAAYTALLSGTSGFNAVLGGNRSIDGQNDRLEVLAINCGAKRLQCQRGGRRGWAKSEQETTSALAGNTVRRSC